MLGRAVSQAGQQEPPTKNAALAKQLFPSSSPAQNGNIQDQFKKARQSQSIGGYTGVVNTARPATVFRGKSANERPQYQRLGSTASSLSSIFSKEDSFGCTPDTTTSAAIRTSKAPSPIMTQNEYVDFDSDDFEDDADLKLDEDYELPPSRPALQETAVPFPAPGSRPEISSFAYNPLAGKGTARTPKSVLPAPPPTASSIQTWPSSSPSHFRTPPGAALRRQREAALHDNMVDLTQDDDINPRPVKRRTLPWAQKKAEEDEISALNDSEKEQFPARAISGSLQSKNRTADGNQLSTPTIKEKSMPWNTTASAIKEQQRAFKEKQLRAKKARELTSEAVTSHHTKKAAPVSLSDEQARVLDLVVNSGKSVFFTGSAGTGKSVLMRTIIERLRKKYMREPDRVAVTASTGLAACNIGGVTLHSFGGIGLGKEDVSTLVKKIKKNQKAKNRWLRTKILIVDEISMVDGDLFDKLEGIARMLRNNGRPFGGIQLVITGDFFQLPPVPDSDKKERGVKFAFEAGTWNTAIHHTIGLTQVFRQKDPEFANMLNEMRLGKISPETVRAFQKLSRPVEYHDSLGATELFPTRNEVENSNAFKMRALHGRSYTYEAQDSGTFQGDMREKLLSNMMAPKTIELKKGAQVMLIKNLDDQLVNGSLGKVVAFMSDKTFEIYNNYPDIIDDQIPDEDLDDDARQARMRLNGLKKERDVHFPLVRFAMADGTSRDLLVQNEEWKVELPNGEVQAQRSQLPLILAWALSIHKAQGQTLERVKIDLKKIFEKGQAYVALSRATSQAGLEVKNFDKSKVMAHPRVGEFYNSLYSVNKALEHPTVVAATAPKKPKSSKDTKEEPSLSMAEPQGFDFDDDEEEAMAAYG
ncbi:ATP-dependent DNA helicase PIF1 [Coleophoma cylindrospora]|uniref:ATP-dependent DNA helicase PIF1 n=1 Tax=Coleophoma cylindrospora TaxID=1849047 RepID=A0A3D8SQV1_9HELO|nr:ATP-dependent DNA helicase PIF1 [Coleophoma cylindrospora]